METLPGELRLRFIDDQHDAAGDQLAWGRFGANFNQIDGVGVVERAEDEARGKEVAIAECQVSSFADGVEIGAIGILPDERVVVAIDDGVCIGQHKRVHCFSFAWRDLHGDISFPCGASRGGCAGAQVAKSAGRQLESPLNCGWANVRFEEGRTVGDDGHRGTLAVVGSPAQPVACGQEVCNKQMLRGKHAIQGLERELPPAVEKA